MSVLKIDDKIKKETFLRSSYSNKQAITEIVFEYGKIVGFEETGTYAYVKFINYRTIQTEMVSGLIPVSVLEWTNRPK